MKKMSIFIKAILLVALVFRFWNLSMPDVTNDDGHIAFRALGWTDYVGGGATTPIQWFGHEPWWSDLSFYDHPPLNFLAQNISFRIFGWNTFAMRFPAALAGTLCVWMLYLFLLKFKNRRVALTAAGLLSISAYYLFINRYSFMDGLSSFFGVLSVYFFAEYLENGKRKDIIFWGASLGLALLSKYTAAFLLPAAIVFLLLRRKEVFKKKEAYAGLAAMAVVLLPIIVYNIMVFATRGHFDAVLSQMVGMKPEDFAVTKEWVVNASLFKNMKMEWDVISKGSSIPFLVLKVLGLCYFIYLLAKKKADDVDLLIAVNMLMIIFMFLFMGPGERYFAIIEPFILAAAAIFLDDILDWAKQKNRIYMGAIAGAAVLIALVEAAYSVNTHFLAKPYGSHPLYFGYRSENSGWNQLDEYIQKEIVKDCSIYPIEKLEDMGLSAGDISGKDAVLYDDRLAWFSWIWYIQKYPLYCKQPFLPITMAEFQNANPLEKLKKMGAKKIYYIEGVEGVFDGVKDTPDMAKLAGYYASGFERVGAKMVEIKDVHGKTAFKVYNVE